MKIIFELSPMDDDGTKPLTLTEVAGIISDNGERDAGVHVMNQFEAYAFDENNISFAHPSVGFIYISQPNEVAQLEEARRIDALIQRYATVAGNVYEGRTAAGGNITWVGLLAEFLREAKA